MSRADLIAIKTQEHLTEAFAFFKDTMFDPADPTREHLRVFIEKQARPDGQWFACCYGLTPLRCHWLCAACADSTPVPLANGRVAIASSTPIGLPRRRISFQTGGSAGLNSSGGSVGGIAFTAQATNGLCPQSN